MARKAFITGVTGQDGAYLSRLLLDKGYDVVGMMRRSSADNLSTHRLDWIGVTKHIRLMHGDILDLPSMIRLLQTEKPDEIYNLAAQSFVQTSFAQPVLTGSVTVPIACLVGIALAVAYSAPWFLRARAVPILDAVISATHFVVPAVAGLALGGAFQQAWIAPLAAFFFWNMGSHVVGALQDVDADRESRIATVGTLLGVRGGGWLAIGLYAVAGLLLGLVPLALPIDSSSGAIRAAGVALLVVGLPPLLTSRFIEATTRAAVVTLVGTLLLRTSIFGALDPLAALAIGAGFTCILIVGGGVAVRIAGAEEER